MPKTILDTLTDESIRDSGVLSEHLADEFSAGLPWLTGLDNW